MADVFSWTERLQRLTEAKVAIVSLQAVIESTRDFELQARKDTFETGTLEALIEARLAGVSEHITSFIVALLEQLTSNNPEAWQMHVRPSYVADWTSTAVDVDDESSGSTLTADAGTPFTGFEVGDVVRISNAEDQANNVERTIGAVTSTVMIFTATLPGTDNDDDEALTLTLMER